MASAQEIYEQLLEDPNLDVGPNQTREEAAKIEAEYRARQYMNNVRALALANDPLKTDTPIKALLNYVQKEALQKVVVNPEEGGGEFRPEVQSLPSPFWGFPISITGTHPVHGNVFQPKNSRFANSNKPIELKFANDNDIYKNREGGTPKTRKEIWEKLPDPIKAFWTLAEAHVLNSHPDFTASGDVSRWPQLGEINPRRYQGGTGIKGLNIGDFGAPGEGTGRQFSEQLFENVTKKLFAADQRVSEEDATADKDIPNTEYEPTPTLSEFEYTKEHNDIINGKVEKLDAAFDKWVANLHTIEFEEDITGNTTVDLDNPINTSWHGPALEALIGNGDWRLKQEGVPSTDKGLPRRINDHSDPEPDSLTLQHFLDLGIAFHPHNRPFDKSKPTRDWINAGLRSQSAESYTRALLNGAYGDIDSASQIYGPKNTDLKQIMNKFHALVDSAKQQSAETTRRAIATMHIANAEDFLKDPENQNISDTGRRIVARGQNIRRAQLALGNLNTTLETYALANTVCPTLFASNHNNDLQNWASDPSTNPANPDVDNVDSLLVNSGSQLADYHPQVLHNMPSPHGTTVGEDIGAFRDALNDIHPDDQNELVYQMLFSQAQPTTLQFLKNRPKYLESLPAVKDTSFNEGYAQYIPGFDLADIPVSKTVTGTPSNLYLGDIFDNELNKVQIVTFNNTRNDDSLATVPLGNNRADSTNSVPINKKAEAQSLTKGANNYTYSKHPDYSEDENNPYADDVTNDLHHEPRDLSSGGAMIDSYVDIMTSGQFAWHVGRAPTVADAAKLIQNKRPDVFSKAVEVVKQDINTTRQAKGLPSQDTDDITDFTNNAYNHDEDEIKMSMTYFGLPEPYTVHNAPIQPGAYWNTETKSWTNTPNTPEQEAGDKTGSLDRARRGIPNYDKHFRLKDKLLPDWTIPRDDSSTEDEGKPLSDRLYSSLYKDPDDEPSRNTSQDADWDISDDSGLAEIQGIADPDEWMFPDGPADVDEHLEDLFGDDWKNNPDAQIELDKIKANNPNLRRALESREQIFPSDTYEDDDLGDASAGQSRPIGPQPPIPPPLTPRPPEGDADKADLSWDDENQNWQKSSEDTDTNGFTGFKEEIAFPDGTIYTGDMVDGKPSGRGVMKYPDGSGYDGWFEEGKRHTPEYTDLNDIEQNNYNNLLRTQESIDNHTGRMIYPDGTLYEGIWENDVPNKFGRFSYPNLDLDATIEQAKRDRILIPPTVGSPSTIYEGQLRDGVPHGQGTLKDVHKWQQYDGNFENGMRHGTGTYRDLSGGGETLSARRISLTGEWQNDKIERGTIEHGALQDYPALGISTGDRVTYEGDLRDNLQPHGQGKLSSSDVNVDGLPRAVYTGSFEDGHPHGSGEITENSHDGTQSRQRNITYNQGNNVGEPPTEGPPTAEGAEESDEDDDDPGTDITPVSRDIQQIDPDEETLDARALPEGEARPEGAIPLEGQVNITDKLNEALTAMFGENWQSNPDAQKVASHYQESPRKIDALYEKHVIKPLEEKSAKQAKFKTDVEALGFDSNDERFQNIDVDQHARLINELKEEKKEQERQQKEQERQQKEQERQQEQQQKEQAKQQEEQQKRDPSSIPISDDPQELPVKEGFIAEYEKRTGKKMHPDLATIYLRKLRAHGEIHKDPKTGQSYMTPETQEKFYNAIHEAIENGADSNIIDREYEEHGPKASSAEFIGEKHDEHVQREKHRESLKGIISNPHHLKSAYYENMAAQGQTTDDIHLHGLSEPSELPHNSWHAWGTNQKSFAQQEALHNIQHGNAEQRKAGKDALAGIGIPPEKWLDNDESHMSNQPPDPEKARELMAQGYEWNPQTHHWHLREDVKKLHEDIAARARKNNNRARGAIIHGAKTNFNGKAFALHPDGSTSHEFFAAANGQLHRVGGVNFNKPVVNNHDVASHALGLRLNQAESQNPGKVLPKPGQIKHHANLYDKNGYAYGTGMEQYLPKGRKETLNARQRIETAAPTRKRFDARALTRGLQESWKIFIGKGDFVSALELLHSQLELNQIALEKSKELSIIK